jgi:hypothetical protein
VEKKMAWKVLRKLMVVRMVLVILILVELQANDLASASFESFHPSPPSTPLPDHFKSYKVQGPFHNCLVERLKSCEDLKHVIHGKDLKHLFVMLSRWNMLL